MALSALLKKSATSPCLEQQGRSNITYQQLSVKSLQLPSYVWAYNMPACYIICTGNLLGYLPLSDLELVLLRYARP